MRSELPAISSVAALLPPLLLLLACWDGVGIKKYLRIGAALLLALGAGFYWAAGYAAWRLSAELPSAWEGQDIHLVGVVASLPQLNERGSRFEFDVERTITPNVIVPPHISLSAYRDRRASGSNDGFVFHAGERWELLVRLRKPHGSVNPYGYDVELWALENNIRATGTIRQSDENRRLDIFVVRPSYWIERIRESIRDRFLAVLGNKPYTGVLIALTIGDQSMIPQSQWTTFWRTGIGHLISISGSHITMLAAMMAGVVGWLWRRTRWSLYLPARKTAALAGFIAALMYSLLAGFSVPTQRTLYMLAVAAMALWFDRIGSASRVLALALLLVLLLDPWAVLAPGFWLSFGAVAVIFYLTAHRRMEEGWLAAAIRTQWAATVGLIPLTIGLFQQLSLISPIANAFAIPLVSFLIVPLVLTAAILPFDWLLHLAHWLTAGGVTVLNWLATWPNATLESPAPPLWAIVLGVIGVIWLLAPRGFPAKWLGLLYMAPLMFLAPPRPNEGSVWMTALDVGQGLAVVVQTQHHTLLYDTGPSWGTDSDSGSRIVVPYLRANGVHRLQGMVVSHADSDHSGGAISVLDNMGTDWLLSSLPQSNPIVAKSDRPLRCHAGQHWRWDGVDFFVLHPALVSYNEDNRKTNDRSCVVKIESPHGTTLLTGDIEALSEAEILQRFNDKVHADILVVPHHGSRTSSTNEFVTAVSPRLAIFTMGYRNSFGHPRPEVVARYRTHDAQILRSDDDGAIEVKLDEQGIHSRLWRDVDKHYWRSDALKHQHD